MLRKAPALLVLLVAFALPVKAQETFTPISDTYPIMRPDRETRLRWYNEYLQAQRAPIDPRIAQRLEAMPPEATTFSLLNYLNYTPAQRDQSSCGNCWTWAGTALLEVALDVQKSIFDRLSLQYMASCYTASYVCCGGMLNSFATWYLSKGKAIPWSNTNAAWADGSKSCSNSTSVACNSISTTPSYQITSLTPQTITTTGIAKETAIANIKNVLNQNKAIDFGFWLPNDADWNTFFNFWNTGAQDTSKISMDYAQGHTWINNQGGGHAVVIVGYVDNGGTDRYWRVLNSWGAPSNRPQGLFNLDMNMDYEYYYIDGGQGYYGTSFQTMDVGWGTVGTASTVLTALWQNGQNAIFNSRMYISNPSSQTGTITARVYTLPTPVAAASAPSTLLGTFTLPQTIPPGGMLNLRLYEDILANIPANANPAVQWLGYPNPYTFNNGNVVVVLTITADGCVGWSNVFNTTISYGMAKMDATTVNPTGATSSAFNVTTGSANSSVLTALWQNGNNTFWTGRMYIWNPSTQTGTITANVYTIPTPLAATTAPSTLLGTFTLSQTIPPGGGLNLRFYEDILSKIPANANAAVQWLGSPNPYTFNGGNLKVVLTITASGCIGWSNVFGTTLSYGMATMMSGVN